MNVYGLNLSETKCKVSWFSPKNSVNGYFTVNYFKYTLAQNLPSSFAIISFVIAESEVINFNNINNLSCENRKVEIEFDPKLKSVSTNETYFSGPFKFICFDYTMAIVANGFREIILYCSDEIFHKIRMSGEKFKSFKDKKASDVVSEIIKSNGGKIKIIDPTDYTFTWLQTKMTDYEMIRFLLPYSRSSNKKDVYCFYLFNNELYFAPIGYNKITKTIPVNTIIGMDNNIIMQQFRPSTEEYGSLDSLYITHHGFSNFENTKPDKMVNQAISELDKNHKQVKSTYTKYLIQPIEDSTLQKIYISNIRHRVHSINRMFTLNSFAIPDITPLDCVKILNIDRNSQKGIEFDGTYYVIDVTYIYGSSTNNYNPMMQLTLSSETDVNGGTEDVEGSKIPINPALIKSESGVDSVKILGDKK